MASQPPKLTFRMSAWLSSRALNSISAALDTDSGFDYAFVGMLELSYERRATDHLGVGLAYSLYHKDAFYDSYSDVHESMHSVMLYMKIL